MNVRQRQPRVEDPAHLAYIRTLPCTVCGVLGCDAAHIRSAAPQYGKRITGMQEKPDDCWVLPLCRFHHMEQHSTNELEWWASKGIDDPCARAIELYAWRRDTPKQQRAKRSPAPRKPKERRANTSPSLKKGKRPLHSRNNLPKKGEVKFPSGRKLARQERS